METTRMDYVGIIGEGGKLLQTPQEVWGARVKETS